MWPRIPPWILCGCTISIQSHRQKGGKEAWLQVQVASTERRRGHPGGLTAQDHQPQCRWFLSSREPLLRAMHHVISPQSAIAARSHPSSAWCRRSFNRFVWQHKIWAGQWKQHGAVQDQILKVITNDRELLQFERLSDPRRSEPSWTFERIWSCSGEREDAWLATVRSLWINTKRHSQVGKHECAACWWCHSTWFIDPRFSRSKISVTCRSGSEPPQP